MKKGYIILLCAVFLIVVLHSLVRSGCSSSVHVANNSKDTVQVRDTLVRTVKRVKHIELNSADSLALVSVYGIGRTFAFRIIEYRKKLGGFHAIEQLKEVRGISDEVFVVISKNLWVDSAKIQKININFASREQLESHPYITPSMARRMVEGRMKGGFFNNSQQLTDQNILLPKESQRVSSYLSFKQI